MRSNTDMKNMKSELRETPGGSGKGSVLRFYLHYRMPRRDSATVPQCAGHCVQCMLYLASISGDSELVLAESKELQSEEANKQGRGPGQKALSILILKLHPAICRLVGSTCSCVSGMFAFTKWILCNSVLACCTEATLCIEKSSAILTPCRRPNPRF